MNLKNNYWLLLTSTGYKEWHTKINFYVKLSLLIIVLILSSCSPSTYIRNTINSPLFEDKNELHASAYINGGEFELQTAFSITPHIGIMANGYTGLPKEFYRINHGYYSALKYDFGFGYYSNLNTDHYFSLFLGGGQGFLNGDLWRNWAGQWNLETMDFQTDYNEYYFQINYYNKIKRWHIGFSIRSNLLHYKSYDYENIRDEYGNSGAKIIFLDKIHKKNVYGYTIDPVVNVHYKLNQFVLLGQFGYSISSLNIEDSYQIYHHPSNSFTNLYAQPRYQRLIFKIGIQYIFGRGENKE